MLVDSPKMKAAALLFQQVYHFRRREVTVAAHHDLDRRPVAMDATDDVTQSISSPDGRLPGRSSDSTGRPVVASKILIGWKQ
jgi:hypothetical protein